MATVVYTNHDGTTNPIEVETLPGLTAFLVTREVVDCEGTCLTCGEIYYAHSAGGAIEAVAQQDTTAGYHTSNYRTS